MDTKRFFQNNFVEYDGTTELLGTDNELIGKITDDIKVFITHRLCEMHEVYKRPIAKKRFDMSHDSSVYTGTTGIVMLSQKLSGNHEWGASLAFTETLLMKAHPIEGVFTFLCGNAGPLALHAIHSHNKGDEQATKTYIDKLTKLSNLSSKDNVDNEMLYGRAGYIYALLLVREKISKDIIPDTVLSKIVNDLINAGLKAVDRNSQLPLHYKWYDEEYIGAAHGYVGILYMLLQVKVLCPGILNENHDHLIVSCLDALLTQRFPSGNLKPSTGLENDKLIHWCHGAPGAIHLYALAYKIYQKSSYLCAAESFADNVWTRGLLRRGYGICHGVAGNGYAHLCMYQLTNDKRYLWRSMKFAEWCLLYGEHGCRTPDTPYSLFEGMSGTLYFLHDMLRPGEAMFPAFQLVLYS